MPVPTSASTIKVNAISANPDVWAKTVVQALGSTPSAWHWRQSDTSVTEGFVRGQVYASYLHAHWNGILGAAARIAAAAREHQKALGRS